ncbi:DUF6958 family protein [Robiginitomaculum antarcticum]|uniref:DUF6958 family protein n=1 Tax=Robiginitomaculum antarcticum TaxID=437507 RepID=UPI00037431D3|nr:hypothetical protein [Robiginitomaculum antarcticum]
MSIYKTACRTPNADGVTNIPTWKFEAVREALLCAIDDAGDGGLTFKAMTRSVTSRLSEDVLSKLGSVGWRTMAVKLELEVVGEIRKVDQKSPQRLVRA